MATQSKLWPEGNESKNKTYIGRVSRAAGGKTVTGEWEGLVDRQGERGRARKSWRGRADGRLSEDGAPHVRLGRAATARGHRPSRLNRGGRRWDATAATAAKREGTAARRRCVSLLAPANCRGQPALAEELTELSRTSRKQAGERREPPKLRPYSTRVVLCGRRIAPADSLSRFISRPLDFYQNECPILLRNN